jgi:hypothetical protein
MKDADRLPDNPYPHCPPVSFDDGGTRRVGVVIDVAKRAGRAVHRVAVPNHGIVETEEQVWEWQGPIPNPVPLPEKPT